MPSVQIVGFGRLPSCFDCGFLESPMRAFARLRCGDFATLSVALSRWAKKTLYHLPRPPCHIAPDPFLAVAPHES